METDHNGHMSSVYTLPSADINELSMLYNSELTRILEDHAPLKSKLIAEHADCLCYTDELVDMKRYKRKLEHKHKQTKLTVDLEIYKDACASYDTVRQDTKKKYYTNQVQSCLNDHKSLFSIINKLLHRSSSSPLPTSDNPAALAQSFADFFLSKIDKINHQLDCTDHKESQAVIINEQISKLLLHAFTPVSEADVVKLIKGYPIKSCPLDPLPAAVFKETYMTMIPVITNIVNESLTTAVMPSNMKEAMIFPILKKPQLDQDILNNYRPVSNLTFLSKLIERAVRRRRRRRHHCRRHRRRCRRCLTFLNC